MQTTGQVSEYLSIRPKPLVGMAIAKTGPDDASLLKPLVLEFFGAAKKKGNNTGGGSIFV